MKCPSCNHENIEGARFCADCGVVLQTPAGEGQDPFLGKLVGGRFRITRQLGEGGMGIVYEGEQQMGSVKRKVAVKTLHKHLSSDPAISARFHRECGTIAQLEHPNTIKVYDFGTTDDGVLYIAMEFLDGKPLDQIVAQGAMDPKRVLHIARQTAGSLEEAHNLGVIHRDLKPENIVLVERAGEKDVVKLLDFGIAARTESADSAREQKLTQQGMVLGTPPYMSPEQFTGQALDRRSDIYSLAIVTYEMLTGRLPFEANTAWQWATQHMTMAPRSFEDVAVTDAPVAMRAAIMKALSKNPDDRQATAAQFVDELAGKVTVGSSTAASGTTGTEQMAAVPKFGATAEPSGTEARGGSHAVARTVSQPVVATTTPDRNEKGGRGMVFGLVALGAILAAGLAFAAFGQKTEEPVASLELPTAAPAEPPPATAEEVPTHGTEAVTETPTAPTVTPTPTPGTVGPKPIKGPTAPKPGSSSTPPATAPSSGDPKPPAETPKPPASSAACDACLAAAKSGNLAAARGAYAACSDAEQKSKCSGIAKRKAGSAVQAAVKSGNCAQAASIAAAAAAMNATSAALKRDVQKCNP